ncbi:YtfJ family protein [Endozoicomonas sp.]|uniref:YtfJ family protein n=1 Tax=Endozoicomonas sp. TaxID=1892382 RepID=UPI0028868933|nr:YtfJ family protein [Endozoicomonas sp.]
MSNIIAGQKLPSFTVEKDGRIIGKGKFAPWSSEALVGEARVFFAIAGSPVAAAKVQPVHNKLKEEAPAIKQVQLVNSKESPMGAAMFIRGEFKKSFKKNPENTYIHDVKAVAKEALGMDDLSALVAVINSDGEVVYSFEGECGEVEVASVMEAIQSVL